MNFATAHVERESGRNQYAEHNRQATSRSFHKRRRGKTTGKKWLSRTLMAEHAAVQPHPMKSARNWETKLRGEGLAAGNRNVYGVPTALQKKSIITSRFTEARSQLLAVKPKRGTSWAKKSGCGHWKLSEVCSMLSASGVTLTTSLQSQKKKQWKQTVRSVRA